MKLNISIFILLFLSTSSFAQSDDNLIVEGDTVFSLVEELPEYPGGDIAVRRFIAENVMYPRIAIENGIQGTVYVRFVINTSGEIEKAEVLKGVDPLLDKEALRVVKNLKKFKPGKQNGKAVKVWNTIPIVFKINN